MSRVAESPSATTIGGRRDNPARSATGCAAPLQRARARAPNSARCRTPTASAERASPLPAWSADGRATPLAIHRKLPSEMRPPARPPTAPGHPASRPLPVATRASAISIARLTRPTNSAPIALLIFRPFDRPEEFTEPGADTHAEPDEREQRFGSQPAVEEVSADRRPPGGHHKRDANGSEPPQRPPRRRLIRHRAPPLSGRVDHVN